MAHGLETALATDLFFELEGAFGLCHLPMVQIENRRVCHIPIPLLEPLPQSRSCLDDGEQSLIASCGPDRPALLDGRVGHGITDHGQRVSGLPEPLLPLHVGAALQVLIDRLLGRVVERASFHRRLDVLQHYHGRGTACHAHLALPLTRLMGPSEAAHGPPSLHVRRIRVVLQHFI